ncbi:MAG TPA: hypothetical protein PK867_20735 [Pirellulales bacterium]|nr:hypothetical protein [Pirellulales bacterium]
MFTRKHLVLAALCGVGFVSNAFAREAVAAPANPFKPGDEIVATASGTPLMRGYSTLATLAEGQTLRVLKVEGAWVGTTVTVNGTKIGGWLWNKQLATPRQYQALRQGVRRSYSYQPAPVYQGPYFGQPTYTQPFVMGETPYGGSYWRADRKVMGY